MHNMEYGQTYFKNLAVFTPQDIYSMFDLFSTVHMNELKMTFTRQRKVLWENF